MPWGEELGKRRCASVCRSLPQWGFRERVSPNSPWHIERYWRCTILRRMEKIIEVIPCVLCFRWAPRRMWESVVCDEGRVRLEMNYVNIFAITLFCVLLAPNYINILYRTPSSHIFPVSILGSLVTSKFKYLQFNKGGKVWKELKQKQ